jgi:cobalamin biosynthesis Co2+ chelatase CbiK
MTLQTPLPPNHQIVLAAFGTSLDPKAAYTSMQVRFQECFGQRIPMGFTSRVGEPKLKAVLESLPADPDLTVVITPIFMIEGQVVKRDIAETARECQHRFKEIRIARPLLPDDRIYEVIRHEVESRMQNVSPEGTGIIFVGHGTPDDDAARLYGECARQLTSLFTSPFKAAFGNLESPAPYLGESLGELIMSGIGHLLVQPFMIVHGVHMHDDVKGALEEQDPDNKLYRFLLDRHGDTVKQRLQEIRRVYMPGLGAYPGVFRIFADHTLEALAAGAPPVRQERRMNP